MNELIIQFDWQSASKGSIGDEIEYNNEEDMGGEDDSAPIQEVRTRVDISPQITEALIQEINDKNWKVYDYFPIKCWT